MEEDIIIKKNNKRKIIILCLSLIIIVVITFIVLKLFVFNKDNNNNNNNQDNKKFIIDIDTKEECQDGEYCTNLFVNGNLVNNINGAGVTRDKIFHLKDALLVVESFEQDVLYIVNDQGKVIRMINGNLNIVDFNRVDKLDIYFMTYVNEFYNDNKLLCELNDDELVYTYEKVTYEGNGKVSDNIVLEEYTKKEYLEHNDMILKCE